MKNPVSALIVDDDGFLRSLMAKQLHGLGAGRVETAADGAAACDALRKRGPFDLVISDLLMPGVDGIELMRELSDIQPNVSIVLMSSVEARVLRTAEELARERHLRLLGALQKPVTSADLFRVLERVGTPDDATAQVALNGEVPVTSDDLRAALAARRIEIAVQPKVDASDLTRVHGIEVLARWTHERYGPVPPQHFVALAEAENLIDELTESVLRKSFEAATLWAHANLHPDISVNLSVASLNRLSLPEEFVGMAARYGISPDRLLVEVTESALSQDLARSMDILARLRMKGVRLSIDDFGTGHSSLERLRRFPFTEVKIDRGFVTGLPEDSISRRIVGATIRMAHELGAQTVAEGVETVEQLTQLSLLGCDQVQGYYVARPMTPGNLVDWNKAREPRQN